MDSNILRCLLLLVFFSLRGGMNAQQAAADSSCNRHGRCCQGGDPTPAGVMISHVHSKNEWMFSYRHMSMPMEGISAGSASRSQSDVLTTYTASPDWMQMSMHMVMAMYGITERLTAMAMLNYNASYMQMTMPVGKGYHHHGMRSSGFGDTRMYALYALSKKPSAQLLMSLGINLPTGSISRKGEAGSMMYPGKRLPYGMQLGSGSYDLLPCVNYLYQKEKLTWSAQIAGTIRTGNNPLGYRLGNELTVNTWGAWQWLSFVSSTLRLEANNTAKITGRDQTLDPLLEPSANPVNYGGKRLFAFLGTSFQPRRGFLRSSRFSIEYGLPVYQQLNGIQMKTNNNLYASYAITF